jgi:hypothetical protein
MKIGLRGRPPWPAPTPTRMLAQRADEIHRVKRRDVITLFGGAALWPLAVIPEGASVQ